MDVYLQAEYIFNKLNEKGAGLGNASIFIIKEALQDLQTAQQSVQSDLLPCGHSVDSLGGFGGCNPNGSCMECAATSR